MIRRAQRGRRAVLFFGFLALALVLSACGGGGGGDNQQNADSGTSPQTASGDVRQIEIDSGEFYFRPNETTVRRGETVEFVVKNSGSLEHNIRIDEFGVDRDYNPRETVRVRFTPNRTGTFKIWCDIPGHEAAGMVATLVVTD